MFMEIYVGQNMKSLNKDEIYEIRDYTIEEKWFDKYVYWAENHFIPFANKRIDIIDFWVDREIDAEISGANPVESENGQPNITWIAKYDSKKERDSFYQSLEEDDEWAKVWSVHPNPDAYLVKNARFFKKIK